MESIFSKITVIYRIFLIITFCVIARVIYVQFINPTETTDEDIAYKVEKKNPNRGDILSRDGRPLCISIPSYKIGLDCTICNPDTFNKYVDQLAFKLSQFFKDKSAKVYKSELMDAKAKKRRYKALGNRDVDYMEMQQIKEFPILKLGAKRGGTSISRVYKRSNPYGRRARITIGFVADSGRSTGLEGSFDFYLKGTQGQQVLQRMPRNRFRPINSPQNIEPVDGYDIQTTIDIDLQESAERALKGRIENSDIEGATAVVMEVKTGAIRAIVNLRNNGYGKYQEIYNYAVREATEPGSTFKTITLTALLEDGLVTLDTPVDASGGRWTYLTKTITDSHNCGLTTVKGALEHSSNVAFAKLAVFNYEKNPQRFIDRIQSMRVGEKFNLDIKGEGTSVIHSPTDAIWTPHTLASMGYGYAILLTPLQTLTFYNAIANNGKMMKPYFVENYQRGGKVLKEFGPQEISGSICSEKTAKLVQEALRGVVDNGTGRMMKNPNFGICGKTGTARMAFPKGGYEQNGKRKYQATFAGFFPAEDPMYSVIVVAYSKPTFGNFYGATWAAPVFRDIANHLYANTPEWNKSIKADKESQERTIAQLRRTSAEAEKLIKTEILQSDSLSCVVGLGLKDALCLLENQGYKVEFTGYGKVVEQQPKAGAKITKGSTVHIRLSDNETAGTIKRSTDKGK